MSNLFKDFFSNILNLGANEDNMALGIDIGSSNIKVVQIKKKKGKAILETYGSIALGPYASLDAGVVTNLSIDKISLALREVLKQAGINTNASAFSLPAESSLIFTIEFPNQIKESEISSMIQIEARKYIPVPINEVYLDHFILPTKEASFEELHTDNNDSVLQKVEKTNVLVVATQNDIISKYRSIVLESNLTSSFFEIEVFSSIRSNFEHELSPVLLIDFGAGHTKLSIIEFGMIKSYHTINRGGADISFSISKSLSIPFFEAEKMKKDFGLFGNPLEKNLSEIIRLHIDYIFSETNNVLLGYEKKYNKTISKIIFSGGGALMKGLKEVATSSFQSEIEIGHPFSKVSTPAFLGKVFDNIGPEFGVALGLALRKLQ